MREISVTEIGLPEDSPFYAFRTEGEQDWLDLRGKGIGGSDVGAIMGFVKQRPPISVWMEKTGRAEPQDLSDNESVEWGTRNEDNIRQKFCEEHPEFQVFHHPDVSFQSKERPWARANLDGIIKDKDGRFGILEIKTADARMASAWDEGVPPYYIAQVTHYLGVTGWSFAYVAVLIGGNRYREYRIERDEEDIKAVNERVDEFWNVFVQKQIMPAIVGTEAESQALMSLYGIGEGLAVIEDMSAFDDLARQYKEAKAMEKEYGERARYCANAMRNVIGANKKAMTDTYRVSWVKSSRERFDTKRFAAEHPDLARQYTTTVSVDMGLRVSEVK